MELKITTITSGHRYPGPSPAPGRGREEVEVWSEEMIADRARLLGTTPAEAIAMRLGVLACTPHPGMSSWASRPTPCGNGQVAWRVSHQVTLADPPEGFVADVNSRLDFWLPSPLRGA